MRDQISEALKGHDAQYVEIRLEESDATTLRYRGRELEEVGRAVGLGGNVRALAGGGWGFASFNDISHLKEHVAAAVSHARRVGGERVALAEVAPHVDFVPAEAPSNPLAIPLADKKRLLDDYVGLMLGVEGVSSCWLSYGDGSRKVYFANSEGSYIEQERIDINLGMSAMARDGGNVQQSTESVGSLGDFNFIAHLHGVAEDLGRKAVSLLRAPRVKGGEYPVILDPVLAGVFIHEAFGHLSEADHIYTDDRMRDLMQMGRRFGPPHLNVVDGAAIPGLRGSYKYDDEGTPAARTYLIREGVLVGRLHSRETAAAMKELPTGNARAINHAFPPIVRMTNTLIEPGAATLQDMLAGIKEGVYAKNWYGGMTSMEMFTFSAGEAYMVRNGKIEELLRPVMLSGNLFTTLAILDMVGNDLDMNQGGGCGKDGQSPLPVSNGSPHVRIRQCLVGGA
ncbi:MAG: TldD/PmbA family protein [Chloroflexi bacterium]|nr:TldD/PmbA family protein [Chloroflexota bacterium]